MRCVDAARVGARLLARGEPQAAALAEVRAAAPAGAEVTVTTDRGWVTVSVIGRVPAALRPLGSLPAPAASARALLEAVP